MYGACGDEGAGRMAIPLCMEFAAMGELALCFVMRELAVWPSLPVAQRVREALCEPGVGDMCCCEVCSTSAQATSKAPFSHPNKPCHLLSSLECWAGCTVASVTMPPYRQIHCVYTCTFCCCFCCFLPVNYTC